MLAKKIFRYTLILIVVFIAIFGFYLYKLHSLAVEGNEVFAIRCTKVNPSLINYKNSFLMFADYLKHPDEYTEDEVKGFMDGYLMGMKEYVVEESKWLAIQKEFMSRWDFQLFEPWYIKKAGELQWKMYEAYKNDAQYVLDIGDQKVEVPEDPLSIGNEPRVVRDERIKEYYEFFETVSKIKDWRKYFGSVPLPEVCNESNLRIPETSGSIDWDGESATPSPEMVPIDPFNLI